MVPGSAVEKVLVVMVQLVMDNTPQHTHTYYVQTRRTDLTTGDLEQRPCLLYLPSHPAREVCIYAGTRHVPCPQPTVSITIPQPWMGSWMGMGWEVLVGVVRGEGTLLGLFHP